MSLRSGWREGERESSPDGLGKASGREILGRLGRVRLVQGPQGHSIRPWGLVV